MNISMFRYAKTSHEKSAINDTMDRNQAICCPTCLPVYNTW
jgi:hypothetical protein